MSSALPWKRLTHERAMLEEENPDYKVFFEDDNLLRFLAYIPAPDSSVYKHKLVKLLFEIPDSFPFEPPKVTFLSRGNHRIHPNFFPSNGTPFDGLVDILCSWWEIWRPGCSIHLLLMSIRPLFDHDPILQSRRPLFDHDPILQSQLPSDDMRDSVFNYNTFVRYVTWRVLLLDYFRHETHEPARRFLKSFIRERAARMMEDFFTEREINKHTSTFVCILTRSSERADYDGLLRHLRAAIADSML
ncbi:UBC-like protein [Nemania abortiva]|nr:UBC-like protein [Nemania abortiva]